jgi:large subunit ribosomal protein L21
MYAIVKTGGKQYRVEQGQTLLVERLPEPEGATVNLETLLYRSEEAVFDAASLAKVEVQATIVTHLRGKKLRVFKFKPKRGYRRRTGHRQELTRIEVTKIGARSPARAAAAKPAADPAGAASAPRAARPRAAAAAAGGETATSVAKAPRARAAKPDAAEAAAPKPRAPRRSAPAKTDAPDARAEASKEDTDGA